jgi:hypothetical protein
MKRTIGAMVLLLATAVSASAQMGMDFFRRPQIAKVFHPVVGKGAQYETVSQRGSDTTTRSMEIAVVGKESAGGKDGYWMQFAGADDKKQLMLGKTLITVDDFEFHRVIVQLPGQGAVEMPSTMFADNHNKIGDQMSQWHSVGSETITVPAGTFSCEHWKNDKDNAEMWTSDKVTPFGMVKEVRSNGTTVLVKTLDDVPDRITGPVKPFDMQQMIQQMQQQKQHPQ